MGKKDSWLDFFGGRPQLNFEIDDFYIPERSILQYKFQVVYRFHTVTMLYEPLLVIATIFVALCLYIFVGHNMLRITRKGERQTQDTKEFDASLVGRAMEIFTLKHY